MIATTRKILLASAATALVMLASVSAAQAEPPVKLVLESQFGAKVNLNESNFCLLSECKATGGEVSALPGGFGERDPAGVAVNNHAGPSFGNIYAVAQADARVQEVTPSGEFVLMFGKDVNETTGADICTEEEVKATDVKCKAGVTGAEAGAFGEAEGVTVDPVSGNVFVSDSENNRVDEYTENGQFVLMIGKEVNEAEDATPGADEAEKNLCVGGSV